MIHGNPLLANHKRLKTEINRGGNHRKPIGLVLVGLPGTSGQLALSSETSQVSKGQGNSSH